MPIFLPLRRTFSPCATMARLKPVSGATSHTVPMRREIEHLHQIGQIVRADRAALARFAVHRRERHQHDAGGGQVALPGRVVQAVGIDHRRAFGGGPCIKW